MTNTRTTQRLEQFIQSLDEGSVTKEEISQAFEIYLNLIKNLKDHLEEAISENKSTIQDISYTLNSLELKVKDSVNSSEKNSLEQVKELSKRLSNEILRIESNIPDFPEQQDLSFFDNRLSKLESKTEKIDTPEEIRDQLEILKGDERLDISAIKGIGKRLSKLSDEIVNRAIGILDSRTSFLINKVSNLETRVNNMGTGGGSGAGVAFETPVGTVNDANVTFSVSNTPVYIIVNGATHFSGAGYTYSAPNITLSSPVGTGGFIRSAYST